MKTAAKRGSRARSRWSLILLCPATFGKTRRQQFPNYPCLTNLVLVAEIASRKRLATIERDRKAAMESLFVGY